MAASFQLGKMSNLITVTWKGKIIIQHAQQWIKMRSQQQHVRISANLWGESAVFFGKACSLKKLIIIIWPLTGDIKESEDIMSFQPCWMRGWESLAAWLISHGQNDKPPLIRDEKRSAVSGTVTLSKVGDVLTEQKTVSIKRHGTNYIKVILYGLNQSGWPGKWLWMFIYLLWTETLTLEYDKWPCILQHTSSKCH